MSRNKRGNRREGGNYKMEEFPEEFDDVFLHNELVDKNKRIPLLRHNVYKTVKDAIKKRVDSYTDALDLEDKFNVVHEEENYSNFEWAVVREEIIDRGFTCNALFDKEGLKVNGLDVEVSRKIELTDKTKNEEDNSCQCKNVCNK